MYDFEALVLIRERTEITESLLSKLPNLKVISQTRKVSNHIDPQLCERAGYHSTGRARFTCRPLSLCWALIMAASRVTFLLTLEALNATNGKIQAYLV
ncbi:hypothetical protein OH492_26465 [Vibrio chagasii]|nr:hypothetical protein [Vibrio chagasii]